MGTRRIRHKDGEFTLFFRKVSPFSNHHPAEFDCDKAINYKETKRFSCTEQYYMYNKASLLMNEKLMKTILEVDNPREMKAICSKGALRGLDDNEWDLHKEKVMQIGCFAKFRASRHLRYALFLSTGSRLVECSPFDKVWGIGRDLESAEWNPTGGRNLLGTILDRVREELWEDEAYQDEREEIEKRIKNDEDYLMEAMENIDLMYKARAQKRYTLSRNSSAVDDKSYLTAKIRELLPEWALPPPLNMAESIRPSPPQITHFRRRKQLRTRSETPPVHRDFGSRLAGRLTFTESRPPRMLKRRRRSCSRSSSNRSRSGSRSRRKRDRRDSSESRSQSRERRSRQTTSRSRSKTWSARSRSSSEEKDRERSRTPSPKNRKERRAALRRSEERNRRKKSDSEEDVHNRSRTRSRSKERRRSRRSDSKRSYTRSHKSEEKESRRSRRSESKEERRRQRKEKKEERKRLKKEKKAKKHRKRHRSPPRSSSESY